MTAESGEETLTPDSLDADSRTLYDRAEKFCKGEYEGDAEALQEAMDGAVAIVALEDETGSKLTERVLKEYLQILLDNGASYVPSDTDLYITPQLNQLNNKMMQIFGLTVDESGAEDILASVSAEDKQTLYDDTMIFFESLYGESVKSYDEVVETEGEMPEETSEEAVEEVYE